MSGAASRAYAQRAMSEDDEPDRPAGPARPTGNSHAARWLAGAALVALALSLSLQQIRSLDYWWHLETGALIAETGAVPMEDTYSYSVPGARYLDAHWLHQLGLHAIHSAGGHAAVVAAKGVLTLAIVALLLAAGGRRDRPGLAALAIALALLAMSDRLMPRPELPTFVLLAAVLAVLERQRLRPDAWIWALVPIHLVWANQHGLFAVGLAVVAIDFVGRAAEGFLPGREAAPRAALGTHLAVGIASGLVCLLNPNGLEGVLYPLKQAAMIGGGAEGIAVRSVELRSPIFAWPLLQPPVVAGFVLLFGASAGGMALNLRRLRVSDALLWGAFAVLALASVRNVALFGVVAAPILVRNGGALLDRARLPARLQAAACGAILVLVAGLAAAATQPAWGLWSRSMRRAGFGVSPGLHPVGAVDWIRANRPPGPLYHHMGDGGYLIRHLRPDYPVLADGRLEVYGPAMRELAATDPAGFRALDRRFRFGAALVSYAQYDMGELLGWLHRERGWRLVFADETSALFVRRGGAGGAPELDPTDRSLFGPLPEARTGPEDFLRRMGRARFHGAVGPPAQAARWRQDLAQRYPQMLRDGG